MGRKDDPDMSPDAALAVEHTPEREAEQLAYFGGEKDDIDDFDATGLDDGSDPEYVAPVEEEAADESADDEPAAEDDDEPAAEAEEEPEAPVEADTDEPGEVEAEADPEPAPKGIPKHRFDEVNERRKAAEEENARLKAELEAGKPPEEAEKPFDFDAAEKEYLDLTLDGDVEAALAKRKEIRAAEHAEWKAEAKAETRTEISQDDEQEELLAMSREAEQMFDVFNPDSENYNQQMLNKVLTFMRGYEAEMPRGDAFVAGLADVVEMYDLMPPDEAEADLGTPPPKKVDKTKAQKQAHQPVAGAGSGAADTGAIVANIDEMSDEELDALPEKALARMRGDFI